MRHFPLIPLIPVALLALMPAAPTGRAQINPPAITRTATGVDLQWLGGNGPFVVETTDNLSQWSAQSDPVTTRSITLPAFNEHAAYRIIDLDPSDQKSTLIGLVQTDQGEFNGLFARHRLKSRLWFYTTPQPPHTAPSFTAADYFLKLHVIRQFLDDGRIRTWSGPLESLGTVAKPTNNTLTLTWTEGTGTGQRTCRLTLDFPYSHATTRTSAPLVSDPRYELHATYSTSQPEFDYDGTGLIISVKTRTESTALYQLDPENGSHPFPSPRKYTVRDRGAEISLHFIEGLPLIEGGPPFIWKTFILDRWLSPTVGGGTLPAFTTDNWFARSLQPGHHNFWETVLIEPALDPAVPYAARAALQAANIKYIYAYKDLDIGFNNDEIRLIGFDHTLRAP